MKEKIIQKNFNKRSFLLICLTLIISLSLVNSLDVQKISDQNYLKISTTLENESLARNLTEDKDFIGLEIIDNQIWARVGVILKDYSGIFVEGTKEERVELVNQQVAWFENESQNVLKDYTGNNFKLRGMTSGGFGLPAEISFPFGLTTNSTDFWIVDNIDKFVYHLDSNGNNLTRGFSIPEVSNPRGITMSDEGFWIVDWYNSEVNHYDKEGNWISSFDTTPSGNTIPIGITTLGKQITYGGVSELYVSDNTKDSLYKYIVGGDGDYSWNCEACSGSSCAFSEENRTISMDSFVNESFARNAIEEGIANALGSPTIYTDLEVDLRYVDGTQVQKTFDKVVFSGNQRWGFNYITEGEEFTYTKDSYNVFNVWEGEDLDYNDLVNSVEEFVNSTKI